MKGVIFAELIHWIEHAWSPAMADATIVRSRVPGDGVYTSVGNYPHQEALSMMGALAELTATPVPALAEAYGYWLSTRFVELYPEMFQGFTDAVSFLRAVDTNHHSEVQKLYPDARPPSVITQEATRLYADARPPAVVALVDGQELTVSYASHRPFADVAFGLIRGYIKYFDDALEVVRADDQSGPFAARFVVRGLAR